MQNSINCMVIKMIIKQFSDGNYYVTRGYKHKNPKKNWFFIKSKEGYPGGFISLHNIVFPKEFLGKRIRLKVEIIDD